MLSPNLISFISLCSVTSTFPASCSKTSVTLHLFQHGALEGMHDQGNFHLSGTEGIGMPMAYRGQLF